MNGRRTKRMKEKKMRRRDLWQPTGKVKQCENFSSSWKFIIRAVIHSSLFRRWWQRQATVATSAIANGKPKTGMWSKNTGCYASSHLFWDCSSWCANKRRQFCEKASEKYDSKQIGTMWDWFIDGKNDDIIRRKEDVLSVECRSLVVPSCMQPNQQLCRFSRLCE